MPSPFATGALAGLRVLDATQMLAGPIAATRLGDLGADVVKIEPPGTGEFNRTHGFEDVRVGGEMSTFLAVNRNKRSLAVDLKHPEAGQVIRDLVAGSDVFLQNFRHGTATRLGVGYEQLAEINPRLIYCSISGYGPDGPYRDRPGQDLVVQGYSGSMFSVGKVGDPPAPGALWAADTMTGYQAVIGILAALQARNSTGRGQHVQVDMFSVVLDTQLQEIVTYLNSGRQPTRGTEASAHSSIPAPYGVYETADGWLTLAMTTLARLGEVLDDDELRKLTAYNDGAIHRDWVYARIRQQFEPLTTAEWMSRCDAAGVWAGPVHDYAALSRDPHVLATGMFVDQPHTDGRSIRTVRSPITLSDTPTSIRRGAPALGGHTRELLAELGYPVERVDALIRSGVLGATRSAADDAAPAPAVAGGQMSTGDEIRLEHDGHVATIVIDRPTKLNAMTVAMDRALNAFVYEINNDEQVRCVVLTGTGERAFSAGSDINDLDEYGSNWAYRNRFDKRSDYARAIWLIRKPVVAAIRGYCIGGGLEMACASDIRIASPDASFGAGEIRWGWHGGSGQTQFLTRQIGSGHASRLLLTGDRIDAAEALRIGLVQQLADAEQVLAEATKLARTISERSPIAIERTKHMIRIAQNVPLDTGLLVENDSFSYLMMTSDAAEGRAAFAEKRTPNFQGR